MGVLVDGEGEVLAVEEERTRGLAAGTRITAPCRGLLREEITYQIQVLY